MKFFAKQKEEKILPVFFKVENEQITIRLEIANRFNVFFTNINKYLPNKLVNKVKKHSQIF